MVIGDISQRNNGRTALARTPRSPGSIGWRQPSVQRAYGLTSRQVTVLRLVAGGKTDKEIANELAISRLTAQKHVANILGRMNVASQ